MDIKTLKLSTEKIIAMFDIYEKTSNRKNEDSISLKANKYKVSFIKNKLLNSIVENKKICEKTIHNLELEMKK